MPILDASNLKQILDPNARYIFIRDNDITRANVLRYVEAQALIVEAEPSDKLVSAVRGFFVASDGRGVVHFAATSIHLELEQPLYRLVLDWASLNLSNRREFYRHQLKIPQAIYLNVDGERVGAKLLDISQGGCRLALDKKLPTQVVFNFNLQFPLPDRTKFEFQTDGLLVYCEPESDPTRFMAGVCFVAPAFVSEVETRAYVHAKNNLDRVLKEGLRL